MGPPKTHSTHTHGLKICVTELVKNVLCYVMGKNPEPVAGALKTYRRIGHWKIKPLTILQYLTLAGHSEG